MDLLFLMFVIEIIITLLCILFIVRITTQPDRFYEQPKDSTVLPVPETKPTEPEIPDKPSTDPTDLPSPERGPTEPEIPGEPSKDPTDLPSPERGPTEPVIPDESPKDPLVRIRKSMITLNVDPTCAPLAETYLQNMEASFKNIFMHNKKMKKLDKIMEVPKPGEIGTFGIGLLSLYLLDNNKTQYLKIVEDLIVKIDEQLEKVKHYKKPLLFIPWEENWYYFSVTLNRMFAMYEYIGENKAIKDICHRRIIQITPVLDRSLSHPRYGVNLVYLGIPRLLTNYLYNRRLYDSEVKSQLFINMSEKLSIHFNPDTVIKDGIYQDYSCICHTVIPNFSYLFTVGGFYINVYRALNFKATISEVVEKILDKTIHSKLDFIGYGMYNRDPRITCNQTLTEHWPLYKRSPDFDVHLFPFIGHGVFKSPNFIFSLRVQRQGMGAYEFSKWVQEYAHGWIQMRKLYLVGVDYSSYESKMEWKDLKLQPGVVSFADNRHNRFDAFRTSGENDTIPRYCENIKSFIGHLKNHKNRKLLYWFNKYEFHAFYGPKVEIFEIGVCTDNGLVMRHEIKNNSGKELKLIAKDKDIGDRMHFKASSNDSGTGTSIPSGKGPVKVNWYQLFDENIKPTTVDWSDANNSMSFNFDGDKYIIEHHGKGRGQYHIVKCNDKIILAGNSSSLRDSSFTHYDTTSNERILFKRDPVTLMYLLKES
ncbi:uncharacterized protein LOC130676754 [Microplitis mediator]|uniref:uncharacterized protein LOC130676754 n=1 Tax=Microplitis mediator TaxID=375433 RepID=UPI0025529C18|nr:uncharacterized protein LOC130676754 [Microplitis mediator]